MTQDSGFDGPQEEGRSEPKVELSGITFGEIVRQVKRLTSKGEILTAEYTFDAVGEHFTHIIKEPKTVIGERGEERLEGMPYGLGGRTRVTLYNENVINAMTDPNGMFPLCKIEVGIGDGYFPIGEEEGPDTGLEMDGEWNLFTNGKGKNKISYANTYYKGSNPSYNEEAKVKLEEWGMPFRNSEPEGYYVPSLDEHQGRVLLTALQQTGRT